MTKAAHVIQRWNEGATHSEIAREIGMTAKAVSSLLWHIRTQDKFRGLVERYGFPVYRLSPALRVRIQKATVRGMGT